MIVDGVIGSGAAVAGATLQLDVGVAPGVSARVFVAAELPCLLSERFVGSGGATGG